MLPYMLGPLPDALQFHQCIAYTFLSTKKKKKKKHRMRFVSCFIWGQMRTIGQETAFQIALKTAPNR